ncbi:hypothetical protein PMI34_00783 [Pseudomonas sp. GM74]|uniref:dermonecrotic toxin domain-containing protein n=1 Tax=Pseudomonas sp. GM74 TaxID=1144336 RepID=UPI0002708351|nr:DUF6543 domain-containing protein [Pseudomonas sp. GM74]EJM95730.1 hypothetical protein PMI34_00783 [Pseudomonas sp. GM74]
MQNEPAYQPADFGLVAPLAPNTEQNLFLSAATRWSDCHDQWLELLAQSPTSVLDEHWWSARARNTALSRRAHATRLYQQHFETSSQLAFARGDLSSEQMKDLLAIIDPANAEELVDARQFQVSRPALKGSDGRRVELSGAMVIGLDSARLYPRMLYLPSAQTAWMSFAERVEMERWLIEHQPQLADHLRFDTATVSVDYTALNKPVLQSSAEFLWLQLAVAAVDRHRHKSVFSLPPELPITDASDNMAPFGQLSPDIPLELRHTALRQQQAALESLLGTDFQSPQHDPRLQHLQQQLDTLAAAEQASTAAAMALLGSQNALHMLELRHQPSLHYSALYHARLDGLRAEADIQLSLKQISAEEHQRLTIVLDAPERTEERPEVVVARLTLSGSDSEGGNTIMQTHELDGVLLFAQPSALQQSEPHSLLLYWPGRFGGLQHFASRQDLEQTLFKRSANDSSLSLQLLPLSRDPFEYALQSQLYNCEQQAARLIAEHPVPAHASQRAVELEKLREQTLAHLTVPTAAARELAYAQLVEQNRGSMLASQLPSWHGALADAQRERLKTLFKSYIKAMKRSHAMLERDLPPREDFSQKAIDTHLRRTFGLKQNVRVLLDVPDSTSWRKITVEGAALGTPQQNVLIGSQQRSKLSLTELAQSNVDQAMWWRLSLMNVEISGAGEAERQKLKDAITQPWLRTLVTELDLAGKYETLIRETFLGTPTASAFSNEHRRECLSEPWCLMLRLQGEFAMLNKDIDADGQRVLNIAIDANSREAYSIDGKRIALLPAHLSVGGADTDKQGPSTLSGVTFIVEQTSGLTLLYLPDSPDSIFVRQYDSLERARKALFNLCLRTGMADYLAGRAVHGDVARHVSRINQALLKNFDAMIGIGMAWPATTSLAAHMVNTHMGRLLEAHRATSRSNDALYLEQCALQSGVVFNYLKMAIGMVPFVGSAVALYDAWGSANLAVAAFLRGEVGHGLAEVEAVLLSLIDAAMDVLPGTSAAPVNVRGITRQRQLRNVMKNAGALQLPTRQQARRTLDRFKGYEYEHDISLAGLHPQTHGIYRNVYRHTDGDFMISHGRIYRIELSTNPLQWRLSGTSTRSYKQPIALDDAGNWNTHYAVYGTIIEGGGAGGGAVLGHMVDGLDPLWPAAIRRWLPRWFTDRTLRRQVTLTNTAEAYGRRLDVEVRNTNSLLNHYSGLERSQRQAHRARLDAACQNDIEIAQSNYQTLEQLKPLSHGSKHAALDFNQSRCAWIVVERSLHRIDLARDRLLHHLDQIDQLAARSEATPGSNIAAHLDLMAQRKIVRKDVLKQLDQQQAIVEEANSWNARISNRAHKANAAPRMAKLNDMLSDTHYYYMKTTQCLEIIARYETVDDLSWFYFHTQFATARAKMGRTLYTQHELPQVNPSVAKHNKTLEDCLTTYAEFRRNLQALTLGYPQHLDLEQVTMFLDNLQQFEDIARNAIKRRPPVTPVKDRSSKQLFETEDNQLLIGVASTDTVTRQKSFTIEGVNGHTETWLPRNNGKYHLSESPGSTLPELTGDVRALVTEAKARLGAADAYKNKVEGYARQNMLPIDLEQMMSSEAAELSIRAHNIEKLLPTDPILLQLRNRSDAFLRAGRTLRIEQSLNSRTPTEGYLDYLLEQQVVDIRKEGGLRDLGKRADGRRDFLQEYEVRDLRSEPAQTLWYAHFHYTSAKPQFSDFVKGHLKRPEQRNLGLQWQKDVAASGGTVEAIWRGDIGKPLGNKHFSTL